MFTVDTSVHINALNPAEEGSSDSQAFLEGLFGYPWPVYSPTVLLVEVAAAVARVFDDTERGLTVARAVRDLPGQIWVPLDKSLADEAGRLAAERRVRGADAIYAAVAHRYGSSLITWDRQQLERLQSTLPVLTPTEVLVDVDNPKKADED
jgi:predicted nucleic acid-binding protein